MPCHPCHPPPGPYLDHDSHNAVNLARATLADRRTASPWGDPLQQISLLATLILEAQSQLTGHVENALDHGYTWNQIRDHLGIPDPTQRR